MPDRGSSYGGSDPAGDGPAESSSAVAHPSHLEQRLANKVCELRAHQAAHEARIATLNEQSQRYVTALSEEILLLSEAVEAEKAAEGLSGGETVHGQAARNAEALKA